jgi:phosphatidylglycerophosphate synthase
MKISYSEVRDGNYSYHSSVDLVKHDVNPDDWRANPYTYLKSRYYIELSSLVAFLFLKFGLSANSATIIYICLGLTGSIFIATGNDLLIYTGIIFLFNKGVFDWADGQIARWSNQASLKGHILDLYGARFISLCFNSSLGIYCYQELGNEQFLLATIVYIFCAATLVRSYASDLILREISVGKIFVIQDQEIFHRKIDSTEAALPQSTFSNLIRRFKFLLSIFDDRARSTDLILLIILIEVLTSSINLVQYIFAYSVIKSVLISIADFYVFYSGTWLHKYEKKK